MIATTGGVRSAPAVGRFRRRPRRSGDQRATAWPRAAAPRGTRSQDGRSNERRGGAYDGFQATRRGDRPELPEGTRGKRRRGLRRPSPGRADRRRYGGSRSAGSAMAEAAARRRRSRPRRWRPPLRGSAERGPENEKPLISQGFFRRVVPRRGLEPPRFYPLVPETSASTNSATWAYRNAVGAAGGVCCVAARRLSTVLSQRRLNTGIGKAGRPQARFSHVERGLYRQRTARARQMRIGAGRRRAGR